MKKEILFGFLACFALLLLVLSACKTETAGKAVGIGYACTTLADCAPGLLCPNKVCVAKYCTDTDGNNILTRGTVYGLNDQNQPFLNSQDYCVVEGGPSVTEYQCSMGTGVVSPQNNVISYVYPCPAGKKCFNGACITPCAATKTCSSTDPTNDIYTKGTTTVNEVLESCTRGTQGGVDRCTGTQLFEAQCNANNALYVPAITCKYGCNLTNGGACNNPPVISCVESVDSANPFLKEYVTETSAVGQNGEAGVIKKTYDKCAAGVDTDYICASPTAAASKVQHTCASGVCSVDGGSCSKGCELEGIAKYRCYNNGAIDTTKPVYTTELECNAACGVPNSCFAPSNAGMNPFKMDYINFVDSKGVVLPQMYDTCYGLTYVIDYYCSNDGKKYITSTTDCTKVSTLGADAKCVNGACTGKGCQMIMDPSSPNVGKYSCYSNGFASSTVYATEALCKAACV